MTVRREILKNNAATTLGAELNAAAVSATVSEGAVLPITGDFRLLIDSEIVLCTARSSNTLTIVRAQEGTADVHHDNGSVVTHILTQGALQRYGRDNDSGFDGGRPPYRIVDALGNPLTASDFTTVNGVRSATVTDQTDATIFCEKPAGNDGVDITLNCRAAPGGSYSVVACLRSLFLGDGSGEFPFLNFGFRHSTSGHHLVFQLSLDQTFGVQVSRFDSLIHFDSSACASKLWKFGPVVWLKARDDGNDVSLHVSPDGVNWLERYSESRTYYFSGGPTHVGWGMNGQQINQPLWVSLLAWNEGA